MPDPLTRFERRGAAAWITLASPANRNALTEQLVGELRDHLSAAMTDDAVRCVVLTGSGTAFCAGADLRGGGASIARDDPDRESPFVGVLKLLWRGPKPVIAGVNGAAFGGGVGLACACDVAIGIESAEFSFSEVRLGLVPATISVVVVPKLGVHQTRRLFLTGERFGAHRALEYGVLHRVVPDADLEEAIERDVASISRGGPEAIREAKELVRTVAGLPMDEAFRYAEDMITRLFASEEGAEGMAAFQEKRAPRWVSGD